MKYMKKVLTIVVLLVAALTVKAQEVPLIGNVMARHTQSLGTISWMFRKRAIMIIA